MLLLEQEPTDVAAASLDIMNDILLKFGHLLGSEQAQLKDILLQGLVDSKPVIRKRAVSCLGGFPSSNIQRNCQLPSSQAVINHCLDLLFRQWIYHDS